MQWNCDFMRALYLWHCIVQGNFFHLHNFYSGVTFSHGWWFILFSVLNGSFNVHLYFGNRKMKKLRTQLYSWSWVDLRMKSLFEDWHPSPPVTKFSKFLKPSTALKANNITHILSRYKLVSHLYQCQLWRWTVLKMEPNLFFWKQYCSISGETGRSKGEADWKKESESS